MERRHPVGGARASLPALSAKRELRSRRDNVSTTASAGVYATTIPFALSAGRDARAPIAPRQYCQFTFTNPVPLVGTVY